MLRHGSFLLVMYHSAKATSMLGALLLLAQQAPDMRAQMDERRLVHDILDAVVPLPTFFLSHGCHVDDFTDPAWPTRHDDDAIGKVDGLVHRVRDEQDRARAHSRKLDEHLLHYHARLRF